MSVASEFLDYSAEKLELYLDRIETCVDKLTPEQVWARQSENENAVGNLILHLEGNIRQWILGGVGGEVDIRDRNAEFDARAGSSPDQLRASLRATLREAAAIVRNVPPERLTERIHPQGYDASVLEAIYQAVQHLAGHAFQIMLLTKLHTSQDLGFFANLRQSSAVEPGRP
ncbi:MAG: DUF1572 family protein [Bryobacteraceae bacterium]|jgi:uncharacterized damage-inducible protein DinB